MQCRMAPHAGGLLGEGAETQTGCRVFRDASRCFDSVAQLLAVRLLPHTQDPRSGQSPVAEGDLWGTSTSNLPGLQESEPGALWWGLRKPP